MSISFSLHSAVATAALTLLAAAAAPAAGQAGPGSRLVFSGMTTAQDLGLPGVRLTFGAPVTIASQGNSGTFTPFNALGLTGAMNTFLVGQGAQTVSSLLVVGDYRFDLRALPGGTYGQADCYNFAVLEAGQRCTPYQSALGETSPRDPLSPFYLTNLATGIDTMPLVTLAAFDLVGTVTGPNGEASEFYGTISSVLPGPLQYVLAGLEAAGSADMGLTLPFEGAFVVGRRSDVGDGDVSVTPEPATVVLVGVGLAAAAGVARRRRA
jgi:hypothetical protein